MRTYKKNVVELDRPNEMLEIRFGNHRIEIEAINDESCTGRVHYLEVRIPSGHVLSNMVQHPNWPGETAAYFTNPEWWSSGHPEPAGGGIEELEGPVRFIAFHTDH